MNGVVIVEKKVLPQSNPPMGPDAAHNVIGICDCILKDKKDGDTVTAAIEGTLIEHDGMRFISVSKVDGEDVEEFPDTGIDTGETQPNDQQSNSQYPQDMNMNSNDALMQFLSTKKGK